MIDDPIVEEVHKTRERLLERYGGIDALVDHFRELEAGLQDRVVTLLRRPPIEAKPKVS